MTGHRLLTLAALTLLAVACNREAISLDEGQERLIDFSAVFAQDATKAQGEITGTDFAAEDSIGVFACYTGDMEYDLTSVSPDFMYNQKVSFDGTNWTYNPVKYWPNNASEKISFFSYFPYISSEDALAAKDGIIGFSKSYAKGDPWLVFRLPETAPYTQTDLMYGDPHLNNKKEYAGDPLKNEKIEFRFKHALACIADMVTVKMSQDLYEEMKDTLDISITGLRIVYSNLTTKACLVLNSPDEPIWKEVISGELLTSRTYSNQSITEDNTFLKSDNADKVLKIDEGHGLFYIPLQIQGQPEPEIRVTLSYEVNGVEDHGTFTDSVVTTVKLFPLGDAGKKQTLALKLTKDFNLDADIITEADGGISMPGDLNVRDEDIAINYAIADTLYYNGTDGIDPVLPTVQKYVVKRTGKYSLEAWGAKGGNGNSSEGAMGGYATAEFTLSIGDVLYVYIGGKGGNPTATAGGSGGWNGGGNGGNPDVNPGGGGGGGATHIAVSDIGAIGFMTTKLSDFEGSVGHLLLVAGGGGGGSYASNAAGSGGGDTGIAGGNVESWGYSPYYSSGRNGHQASNGTPNVSGCLDGNGGGGGGYRGGNVKFTENTNSNYASGGSGGSSKANTARYNYVTDTFLTYSVGATGYIAPVYSRYPGLADNGLVIITFKENVEL